MIKFILLAILVYAIFRAYRMLFASSSLSPQNNSQMSANSQTQRPPHIVLGIKPKATDEEIRAAYQRLIHENHPDRVATMSDEIRALALAKTKEINWAYDQLKRS